MSKNKKSITRSILRIIISVPKNDRIVIKLIKLTELRKSIKYVLYYNIDMQFFDYDGGTFRCKTCAKEFLSKTDIEKHIIQVHHNESTSIGE